MLMGRSGPRGYAAKLARNHSQPVHRTLHAERASVHHVQINHRRPDAPMAEEFLYCANVVPIFEEMRGEAVSPHHVRAEALGGPSQPCSVGHRRGRTDVSLDCEPGQKRRDVGGARLGRMGLFVEDDVTTNPVDIRSLRPAAVMPRPYEVPHPIEELGARACFWQRNDVRRRRQRK